MGGKAVAQVKPNLPAKKSPGANPRSVFAVDSVAEHFVEKFKIGSHESGTEIG